MTCIKASAGPIVFAYIECWHSPQNELHKAKYGIRFQWHYTDAIAELNADMYRQPVKNERVEPNFRKLQTEITERE